MNTFTKLQRIYFLPGLIAVITLLFAISTPVSAQNFETGLSQYERGNFRQAATIFASLEGAEARLFAGKSYFSLGDYLKAQSYLNSINPEEVSHELYHEMMYTNALAHFQLKQFGRALEYLYPLSSTEQASSQIVLDATNLYQDILQYLTLDQRREAFHAVNHPQVRYDLIRSAFGMIDFATAQVLFHEYRKTLTGEDTLSARFNELRDLVSDSVSYSMERTFGNRLQAPSGIVYNIGAALPRYKPSDNEFSIAQGLYYGYVLAAEEFNQRHRDKKVFIKYSNTGISSDSSAYAMTDFAWNYHVDAVLGPLYSEPAKTMSELAELYQIPMLAPLANSDDLNTDNPYLYQANPTFASHGRKMARFAVNELQMDTLAVLAEANSLGATSAFEFREEAEKLGAKVVYFFVEDLESIGYEIGNYTKYFTSDQIVIDSLNYHRIDGVYAPFTGQAAPTLIDLLLIDLQAMNSDIVVLGSQEWGITDIAETRLGDRTVYFSESYYLNSKSERVERFRSMYSDRFGIEPNRFSMIGYDAASYLLSTLNRVENPALLKNALKESPLYEGLISNIHFDGHHINQEVKIFSLTAQGIQPAIF